MQPQHDNAKEHNKYPDGNDQKWAHIKLRLACFGF
jgi:hypothetical protein